MAYFSLKKEASPSADGEVAALRQEHLLPQPFPAVKFSLS